MKTSEENKAEKIIKLPEDNKTKLLQKTPIVILLALFCSFLWGSAFSCIKVGYQLFNIPSGKTASQILFAGSRFALAGIMVIIAFSIIRKSFLKPYAFKKIMTLSIFQTVLQYIAFYIGLAHTTGVKSSIINGSSVFITILVACLIFHQEKLTAKKIVGATLGVIGVVIVNLTGGGLDWSFSFLGEGMILISSFSFAFSSAYIKKYSDDTDVVMLSGYQFFFGGLIMMLIGVLAGGKLQPEGVSSFALLGYMGFISSAAYTIWSILLKYNEVSKVSVYKFMNPVFGVILSFIILNEKSQLGINTVIALILVCVGIYIVNAASDKKMRYKK